MSTDTPGRMPRLFSSAEAQQVFTTTIVPELFGRAAPQTRPRAVLLLGHPGTSPETAVPDITRAHFPHHPDGRPIVINSAQLTKFHPNWRPLLLAHGPAYAFHAVSHDVSEWVKQCADIVSDQRLNAIIMTDPDTAEKYEALVSRLARTPLGERPCQIGVQFLAVHKAASWLNLLARHQLAYEAGVDLNPHPDRFVHDSGYNQLLTTAEWVDADDRISSVGVLRRVTDYSVSPRVFFAADDPHRFRYSLQLAAGKERDGDGQWGKFSYPGMPPQPTANTAELIDICRNLRWNELDSRGFEDLFTRLCETMRADHWASALAQAELDAQAVLAPTVDLIAMPYDPGAAELTQREAVLVDHFQVVTTADIAVANTLAGGCRHVDIAVIDERSKPDRPIRPPGDLLHFYGQRAAASAATRNALSVAERQQAWMNAIEAAGLPPEQFTITHVQRPELDPAAFNRRYPPQRFNRYFGTDRPAPYRVALDGPVEKLPLPPGQSRPSLDQIAQRYQQGDPTWEADLAPGAREVFLACDGPHRLLANLAVPAPQQEEHDLAAATALGADLASPAHDHTDQVAQPDPPRPLDTDHTAPALGA